MLAGIPKFPQKLSIQTVSHCNAACVFCPYPRVKNDISHGIMDWNLYRKIIDECSRHPEVERIIPYLMNEPLLDREIAARINYAKEKNPQATVHILTNGSLLNEELTEELISSKLDWIGFSIQGIDKDTYENAMVGLRVDDVIPKVSAFIERARGRRDAEFILVTFLCGKHLPPHERDGIRRFWQTKGVRRISSFEAPVSCAGNVSTLPTVSKDTVHGCRSIWTNEMIHILWNGDVILCCMDWRRQVVLGNVREASIEEVWNSQRFHGVREMVWGLRESPRDFLCKRCEESVDDPLEQRWNGLHRRLAALRGFVEQLAQPKGEVTRAPGPFPRECDIALATMPPWGVNNPPVGLGVLAAYLKEHGFRPAILDFNMHFYNVVAPDFQNLWHVENKNYWSNDKSFSTIMDLLSDHIDEAVGSILGAGAPAVGFSVVDPKERITIETIRRLKARAPHTKVILGGPACSCVSSRRIFHERAAGFIDAFVVGEGEETLRDILEAIRHNRDVAPVPGVLTFRDGVESFAPRDRIRDLDTVPFPTFDEFPTEHYLSRSLIVEWSRGCIGNCAYCKGRVLDGPFRSRTALNIFNGMTRYCRERNITDFTVCDSVINGNPGNLAALSELIVDRGLEFTWRGEALPLPAMTAEILYKMHDAGCVELQYGLESASRAVLEKMGKLRLFTPEEAERVIRDTHEVGIKTALFIIVGFPGETEKDFQKTMGFVKRNGEFIDQLKSINTLHIIYDTPLYNNPEKFEVFLPKRDEHYRWFTKDGNTTAVRNRRAKQLIQLAEGLGIEILETNIIEGKQYAFENFSDVRDAAARIEELKAEIGRIEFVSRF